MEDVISLPCLKCKFTLGFCLFHLQNSIPWTFPFGQTYLMNYCRRQWHKNSGLYVFRSFFCFALELLPVYLVKRTLIGNALPKNCQIFKCITFRKIKTSAKFSTWKCISCKNRSLGSSSEHVMYLIIYYLETHLCKDRCTCPINIVVPSIEDRDIGKLKHENARPFVPLYVLLSHLGKDSGRRYLSRMYFNE